MTQVTIQQAAQHLRDLIDAAVSGEEVIVAQDAQTAVRLVPVKAEQARPQFGSARGLIEMADDFDAPLDDFGEYAA